MNIPTIKIRIPKCASTCCGSSTIDARDDKKSERSESPEAPLTYLPGKENRYPQWSRAQSSGVMPDTEIADEVEEERNVVFTADATKDLLVLGGPTDEMHSNSMQEGGDLATFLSRPVRINELEWEVGTTLPTAFFNPWLLFLSDPRVVNKLETFKLLHGTLNIQIMVNGSPFHYGQVIVGVRPTQFDNNTTIVPPEGAQTITNYRDEPNAGVKTGFPLFTMYSSRPHVKIQPMANKPQHIKWPFFAATSWIDITDIETINRMGFLEVWEMNDLRHANGGTDPITITFYAWMEDVELAGLTTADVSTAQSSPIKNAKPRAKKSKRNTAAKRSRGNVEGTRSARPDQDTSTNDEYSSNGVISAPASAIASAAGYLTQIPVIGPFAKATQIGMNAVSRIASIFGFSNPVILDPNCIMTINQFGQMATTTGKDPIVKLTMDPKQEINIDPRTVGLDGTDELSILYVAKREAYLNTFNWNILTAPNQGLLASCYVHPRLLMHFQEPRRICNTPLSGVTQPFKSWTGALRFRIQIIATRFHKGRLLIQFDPTLDIAAGVNSNSQFQRVVDIAEERDFTIEVNWSQAEDWRSTILSDVDNEWFTEGPIGAMSNAQNALACNGRLNIFVLNQLGAPTDTATIQCNVWISAGDSFKVANPGPLNEMYSNDGTTIGPPDVAQSGQIVDITVEEGSPSQDVVSVLNGSYDDGKNDLNSAYFGEAFVSIRSLLKRYTYYTTFAIDQNNVNGVGEFRLSNFPGSPGKAYTGNIANQTTVITGPVDYNYVGMSYIRWFAGAYVGFRGGVRYKWWVSAPPGIRGQFWAQRSNEYFNNYTVTVTEHSGVANTGSQAQLAWNMYDGLGAAQGQAVVPFNSGSVIGYEVPYFHDYLFGDLHEPVGTAGDQYQVLYQNGGHIVNLAYGSNTGSLGTNVYGSVAAAEDFTFFFFIGFPPSYDNEVGGVTPA